jgi:hypothetical protein
MRNITAIHLPIKPYKQTHTLPLRRHLHCNGVISANFCFHTSGQKHVPLPARSSARDGQLDAHLSVDGQGVHAATTPIQLRSFSPLREELQINRRTRYIPNEFQQR